MKRHLAMFNHTAYGNSYTAAKQEALYFLTPFSLTVTDENVSDVLTVIEAAENAVRCAGNPECYTIVFCETNGTDSTPAKDFVVDYMRKIS